LLNNGNTQAKIADFIGISLNKVSYWCIHGGPENIETLKDKRMKGHHKKATDKYIEILLETIEKEPQELGCEFGRWSTARLATYLEEQTGVKLTGSQVRRIIKQKKYVYIWTKYSLESRINLEKRQAFKEKLKEYLNIEKASPERLQLWFWDEAGFSLIVIPRKIWGKKGSRKDVRADRRKGLVNVMGGMRYSDKKKFVEILNKGNADNFYEVIFFLLRTNF
jgi:transposase